MWRIMEENHFEKCTSTEWPEECHTGPWSKQAVCCFRAASFRFWSLVGPTFPRLRLKKSPIFRGCCVVRHGKSGSNKWGMLQRTIMICHCFVFLGYALLAQVHSETTDLSSTPLSQPWCAWCETPTTLVEEPLEHPLPCEGWAALHDWV